MLPPSSTMATALASLLPKPTYAPTVSDDEDEVAQLPVAATSQSVIIRAAVPPYGQRPGWKPTSPDDFGELPINCSHPQLIRDKAMAVRIPNAMSRSTHWAWGRRKCVYSTGQAMYHY